LSIVEIYQPGDHDFLPGNLKAEDHEKEAAHHHENHVQEEMPMVSMANTVI
jgi:hypothetical protein